jgi:hypothetical protein
MMKKRAPVLHRMGVNLRHKPSAVSLQRFKGEEPLEIECKHRRKAGSEQQKRDPSAPSNVAARCRALMTDHHEPPPGTPGSTLFQEDFPADLFPAGSPNQWYGSNRAAHQGHSPLGEGHREPGRRSHGPASVDRTWARPYTPRAILDILVYSRTEKER